VLPRRVEHLRATPKCCIRFFLREWSSLRPLLPLAINGSHEDQPPFLPPGSPSHLLSPLYKSGRAPFSLSLRELALSHALLSLPVRAVLSLPLELVAVALSAVRRLSSAVCGRAKPSSSLAVPNRARTKFFVPLFAHISPLCQHLTEALCPCNRRWDSSVSLTA
jgi:hypothetical protein